MNSISRKSPETAPFAPAQVVSFFEKIKCFFPDDFLPHKNWLMVLHFPIFHFLIEFLPLVIFARQDSNV